MANIKIAQLTNATTLNDTDLVIVEDGTQTKKMTVANLRRLLLQPFANPVTLSTTTTAPGGTATLNESMDNFQYLVIETADIAGTSSYLSRSIWFKTLTYIPLSHGGVLGNIRLAKGSATGILFLSSSFTDIRIISVTGYNKIV